MCWWWCKWTASSKQAPGNVWDDRRQSQHRSVVHAGCRRPDQRRTCDHLRQSLTCQSSNISAWKQNLKRIITVMVLSQISIHPKKRINWRGITRPSCFLCLQKPVQWLKSMFLCLLLHPTESIRMQEWQTTSTRSVQRDTYGVATADLTESGCMSGKVYGYMQAITSKLQMPPHLSKVSLDMLPQQIQMNVP